MDLKDFNYELPEELIAQVPLKERESSRLLVLKKKTGNISHHSFKEITEMLKKGDCLVLNNTRVIPARLLGEKQDTGGKIEFVLLKRLLEEDTWEVILKPGKRAKPGARFVFGGGILTAEILEVLEEGNRRVRFYYDGIFDEILDRVGLVPLPPYITQKLDDRERYQTVYSDVRGSAAAPTAGLHFSKEILSALSDKGVKTAYVTLHVGLGTFRPVKVSNILEHKMHSESFAISEEASSIINGTRQAGGRVIAVGTTSCRVLESAAGKDGLLTPQSGETDIFIYPGYEFKAVDGIITNFHLPESTLIMLVSAFAGRDKVMEAYNTAVAERYRFFSFGDAMFIY